MYRNLLLLFLFPVSLFAEPINYKDFTDQVFKVNPQILQLGTEINSADNEVDKAKSAYLPTVDFTGSYTFLQNPMDSIYLNISDFDGIIPGYVSTGSTDRIKIIDAQESNYYNFNFKITQPIFTWGKIPNSIKIYETLSKIKYIDNESLKRELETKIKIYFYSISILKTSGTYIEKQFEAAKALKNLSQENYDNGFIEYSTLLEIEYLELDLEVGFKDLKYQIESLIDSLRSLINNPDLTIEDLDLDVNLNIEDFTITDDTNVVNKQIMLNPAIKQLTQLKKIKEYESKLAKGSLMLLPDLALQIDLGYSGSRLPLIETDWYRQDDHDLNITFALKTTIFDGGISYKESDIKKENITTVSYQIDNVINTLKQETISKRSRQKLSIDKMDILERRVALSKKKRELSDIKFQEGLILETELLEDDMSIYLDQINYQTELLSYFVDYWTLENILGLYK